MAILNHGVIFYSPLTLFTSNFQHDGHHCVMITPQNLEFAATIVPGGFFKIDGANF